MHNRPDLSDEAVVSYVNMDFFDEENVLHDAMTSETIEAADGVNYRHRSTVPYNSTSSARSNVAGVQRALNLAFSGAAPSYYHIFSFEGLPYNYLTANADYLPLNPEHYSIVYPGATALGSGHTVTVTYTHPSVLEGDEIVMGVRRLGVEDAFENLIPATSVSTGRATFNVPGDKLKYASEAMFYVTRASGARPINVVASFGAGLQNGQRLMIDEETRDVEIPINFNIISGNLDDRVEIEAIENYATMSRSTVDMTRSSSSAVLHIDRRLIDTRSVNPVTVRFAGADIPDLNLEVYLEPTVELRLTNGSSPNTMTASSLYPTLEIEAELIDGYLEGEVELSTIADISTSMSIGSGTLLTDSDVTLDNLSFENSSLSEGSLHEGWNLVGNPYLVNVNLTKIQNVIPDKMTKFIYQYDASIRNFAVYDMSRYNEQHTLLPMQPCFVQVLDHDASLTVTPVAKERCASKKTLDFYAPELNYTITLGLESEGKTVDRTTVTFDSESYDNYLTGEDASKMTSLSPAANSMWCIAPGGIPVAVDYVSTATKTIPLALDIHTPGELALVVEENIGCGDAYLHDKVDDTYTKLDTSSRIPLPEGLDGEIADRYEIVTNYHTDTHLTNESFSGSYEVWVDGHECIIDGLLGDAFVSIFCPDGIAAVYEHTSEPSRSYNLETGIYLVEIKENNKVFTVKILVRP